MPLVARDLLHGGAQTYGIMLGAFGMGAGSLGALNIGHVRRTLSGEAAVRACALSMAGAIAAVAFSRQPVLTAAALVLAGAVWMLAVALFNIGVQLAGAGLGCWMFAGRPSRPRLPAALRSEAGVGVNSPTLPAWKRRYLFPPA